MRYLPSAGYFAESAFAFSIFDCAGLTIQNYSFDWQLRKSELALVFRRRLDLNEQIILVHSLAGFRVYCAHQAVNRRLQFVLHLH